MSGYPHNPSSYGTPAQSYGAPPQTKPHSSPYSVPVTFPPGTDANARTCFYIADRDGDGIIDDKELQRALLSYDDQSFSIRTIHLLMYVFTNTNNRKIGPKEFPQVFQTLNRWRDTFVKFDRDGSGKLEANVMREALTSLDFWVSPVILDILMSKFDKTDGKNKAIKYDNFIECCLTLKGLGEKFVANYSQYNGPASFTYEAFMLTVLPFLIA